MKGQMDFKKGDHLEYLIYAVEISSPKHLDIKKCCFILFHC